MLRLFEVIFGKTPTSRGRYPDTLVQAAIERAIEGTDSRLCAVPGYKRRLEPAVVHAIDHVVALVDELPAPVDLGESYRSDPRVSLFFMSPEHMREVVSADQSVRGFLKTQAGQTAENVVALLALALDERQVFGAELEGDNVRRDVAQVTVSVSGRRLVDPAPTEELARRLLKRRAFDHLLGMALGRMAAGAKERAELAQERTLLRRKHQVLKSAGWTFEAGADAESLTPAAIEAKLEEIEQQLRALGGDTGALELSLDRLIEVLDGAEKQLWKARRTLIVDRMGIKRDQPSDNAPELDLEELHNAKGDTAIVLPVSIPRRELRASGDMLAEAKRYLG